MPQQLIYTSAQRGVVAGRSGHCTVARSAVMREMLMLQLEKLSYYQHLSLSGGQERRIFSNRVLDIRGSRFHILSRIQDAGLDFTGRTNFLAHHLVFTPEEVRQFPSPPVILRGWSGWVKAWNQEPQMLENEDWSGLAKISGVASVPATTWQQVTGDAANGYGLLEARSGSAFRVDNLAEDQILALFAESLELLELRDPRRDFRVTAWQYTFTTSMQEQDNPADFRWRCLHSDNPASSRFAGPDCRPLSEVRALRVTSEEKIFAQSGRQAPHFVIQPQNIRITDGQPARLYAKAEGVPSPSYQWFAVDKAGNGHPIANGTDAEMVLPNPPVGVSRYVVRTSNSQGDVTSEVATLSVESKLRLETKTNIPAKDPSPIRVKPKIDYGREFESINSKYVQSEEAEKGRSSWKWPILGTMIVAALTLGIYSLPKYFHKNSLAPPAPVANITKVTGQLVTTEAAMPPKNQSFDPKPSSTVSSNAPVETTNTHKDSQPSDVLELPPGWTQMIVGSVTNYRVDPISVKPPFRFDLEAVASGFSTNGDNTLFVCRTNPGTEFEATLLKVSADSTQRLAGIMLRESKSTNSLFLFIGASPQEILAGSRDRNGAFHFHPVEIPNDVKSGILKLPLRLKFLQKDSQFSAYFFDSKEWFQFPDEFKFRVSTNGQPLVGFALSSGSADHVTAQFVEIPPTK